MQRKDVFLIEVEMGCDWTFIEEGKKMPELKRPGSSRLSNTNPGMKEYMLVLVAWWNLEAAIINQRRAILLSFSSMCPGLLPSQADSHRDNWDISLG